MRLFPGLPILVAVVGALLLATAGPTQAVCFEGSLVTQMEADGFHVQITLTQSSWSTQCWPSEPVGVDVYRRELGATCGPLLLVTGEPLPWVALPGEGQPVVLGEIVDESAATNTAYEYVARAVDAQRGAIPGDPDAVLGYATAGEAMIGLGELVAAPDCGVSFVQWIASCDGACFPNPFVGSPVPAEVLPYFNSGATLRIYGEFDGISPTLCNVHLPRVLITRVEEGTCVVPVQPTTWGAVKSVYQ
jgi:hypothetical protein